MNAGLHRDKYSIHIGRIHKLNPYNWQQLWWVSRELESVMLGKSGFMRFMNDQLHQWVWQWSAAYSCVQT